MREEPSEFTVTLVVTIPVLSTSVSDAVAKAVGAVLPWQYSISRVSRHRPDGPGWTDVPEAEWVGR